MRINELGPCPELFVNLFDFISQRNAEKRDDTSGILYNKWVLLHIFSRRSEKWWNHYRQSHEFCSGFKYQWALEKFLKVSVFKNQNKVMNHNRPRIIQTLCNGQRTFWGPIVVFLDASMYVEAKRVIFSINFWSQTLKVLFITILPFSEEISIFATKSGISWLINKIASPTWVSLSGPFVTFPYLASRKNSIPKTLCVKNCLKNSENKNFVIFFLLLI